MALGARAVDRGRRRAPRTRAQGAIVRGAQLLLSALGTRGGHAPALAGVITSRDAAGTPRASTTSTARVRGRPRPTGAPPAAGPVLPLGGDRVGAPRARASNAYTPRGRLGTSDRAARRSRASAATGSRR